MMCVRSNSRIQIVVDDLQLLILAKNNIVHIEYLDFLIT